MGACQLFSHKKIAIELIIMVLRMKSKILLRLCQPIENNINNT
jgi:hypothetical protein